MVLYWTPPAEVEAIEQRAWRLHPKDAPRRENELYSALFNRATGLYSGCYKGQRQPANVWSYDAKGNLVRLKTSLSRREWIELYFRIRNKAGKLVPLILNRAQRRLEVAMLRQERAGRPVRIIILKARQMGFSTFVQACMYWLVLCGKQVRGLIVADNEDRSKMLLRISDVARRNIPKAGEECWNFSMPSRARYLMQWAEPIDGEIQIDSAAGSNPGRGGTPSAVHMSETAHWIDAGVKMLGILESLPTLAGTYAWDESTANGEDNRFCADYRSAKKEADVAIKARTNPYTATFFAWWEHEEYHWTLTFGSGDDVPDAMAEQILATIDVEEKWLLKQSYFARGTAASGEDVRLATTTNRLLWDGQKLVGCEQVELDQSVEVVARTGVGWRQVNVDQLAWRRAKLHGKEFNGNVVLFDQEYPSRDEVAFSSSGNPVYDPARLAEYQRASQDPIWRGDLPEIRGDEELHLPAYGVGVRREPLDGG